LTGKLEVRVLPPQLDTGQDRPTRVTESPCDVPAPQVQDRSHPNVVVGSDCDSGLCTPRRVPAGTWCPEDRISLVATVLMRSSR